MATELFKSILTIRSDKTMDDKIIQVMLECDINRLSKMLRCKKLNITKTMKWNKHNHEHVYPIHIACAVGSLEAVKFLLRMGSSIETKTASGLTPLHFTAMYNHIQPEVATHLIDMGAKITTRDAHKKRTAFHYACENNNVGVTRFVLDILGMECEFKDYLGKSARDLALANNCEEVLILLHKFSNTHKQKEELSSLPKRVGVLEQQLGYILKNNGCSPKGRSSQTNLTDGNRLMESWPGDTFVSRFHGNLKPPVYGRQLSQSLPCLVEQSPTTELEQSGLNPVISSYNPATSAVDWKTCCNHQKDQHFKSMDKTVNYKVGIQALNPNSRTLSEMNLRDRLHHHDHATGYYKLSNVTAKSHHDLGNAYQNRGERVRQLLPDLSTLLPDSIKTQLIKNYNFICSNMKPDRVIIKLFSKEHFDLRFKKLLSDLETDYARNDRILSQLVLNGGLRLYRDFVQSLRETNQEHIVSQVR